MDDFNEQVLRRLPLAESVLRVLGYVFEPSFTDELYERHRGRGYERQLSFPVLLELIRDALLLHEGSGRQSFDRAAEAGRLPVTVQNAYAKFGRLPLALSQALLREGTTRLGTLMPEQACWARLPRSREPLTVVVADGKKLKNAAKRLKVLRGLPGKMLAAKLLAAKLLVALDLRRGLVVAMHASPDGEANDVPLVGGLLPQVRSVVPGPRLWVVDRQFCDLELPGRFSEQKDHYVIRFNRKMSFEADPSRPAQTGVETSGRTWTGRWGWIGSPSDSRRRYVRQITLEHGEDPVILITDLLEESSYPAADLLAADLLAVYLQRWGIERVFQQVTEVFALQRLIGSTPLAATFQNALCMLLYNIIQLVRVYVAQASEHPVQQVSTEKLFYDVRRELAGWSLLADVRQAAVAFGSPADAAEVAQSLSALLANAWTRRWLKAPPKRKPSATQPPPTVPSGHAGHSSVWRIIQASHALPPRQRS